MPKSDPTGSSHKSWWPNWLRWSRKSDISSEDQKTTTLAQVIFASGTGILPPNQLDCKEKDLYRIIDCDAGGGIKGTLAVWQFRLSNALPSFLKSNKPHIALTLEETKLYLVEAKQRRPENKAELRFLKATMINLLKNNLEKLDRKTIKKQSGNKEWQKATLAELNEAIEFCEYESLHSIKKDLKQLRTKTKESWEKIRKPPKTVRFNIDDKVE